MQIYANVLGQPMLIAGSPQTPALGAAISAAVTAGSGAGGYDDWHDAQQHMTTLQQRRFDPEPGSRAVYDRLYALYRELHDSFGGVAATSNDHGQLMKRLMDVRRQVTA
jgi:L-ribulokinase